MNHFVCDVVGIRMVVLLQLFLHLAGKLLGRPAKPRTLSRGSKRLENQRVFASVAGTVIRTGQEEQCTGSHFLHNSITIPRKAVSVCPGKA
jgi:hypothetical protein